MQPVDLRCDSKGAFRRVPLALGETRCDVPQRAQPCHIVTFHQSAFPFDPLKCERQFRVHWSRRPLIRPALDRTQIARTSDLHDSIQQSLMDEGLDALQET